MKVQICCGLCYRLPDGPEKVNLRLGPVHITASSYLRCGIIFLNISILDLGLLSRYSYSCAAFLMPVPPSPPKTRWSKFLDLWLKRRMFQKALMVC